MRADWVREILDEPDVGAVAHSGVVEALRNLRKAVKFSLPRDCRVLGLDPAELSRAVESSMIRLPFPSVALCFEWDMARAVVIASETDDGFTVRQAIDMCRTGWRLTPVIVEAKYGPAGLEWRYGCLSGVGDEEKKEEIVKLSHSSFGAVVEFCLALRCKNVYQEEIQLSKLAKMRAASKRKEVYSYHTLVIDPDGKEVRRGAGTHASPRVHLRRGHIRRLPSGDIWVNACVVGDKSAGMVSKDYAVAQSSSLH